VWYVVSWAGVITPWVLPLLALGGGVRMPISRSIRVTSVGQIKKYQLFFDLLCLLFHCYRHNGDASTKDPGTHFC